MKTSRLLFWGLRTAAAVLTLLSFFVLLWLLVSKTARGNACIAVERLEDWEKLTHAFLALAWPVPCLWLVSVAVTPHICWVAVFLMLNWATALMWAFPELLKCTNRLHETPLYGLWNEPAVAIIGWMLIYGLVLASYDLVLTRFEALEAKALESLGIWPLRAALRVFVAILVLSLLFGTFRRKLPWGLWATAIEYAMVGVMLLIWWAAVGWGLFAAYRIMRIMRQASRSAPGWIAAWAKRFYSAFVLEVVSALLTTSTSAIRVAAYLVTGFLGNGATQVASFGETVLALSMCMILLYAAMNLLFALLLSGALSGAVQGTERRARLARQRSRRCEAACRSYSKRTAVEDWDGKVQELAGRGISLEVLLSFYTSLPETMPHFEPAKHSTADVVRQVVIPLTSRQRCSGAELLMEGKTSQPSKMVTHAWDNVFRDLVAAVVADAIGEGEYAFFAKLMDADMEQLKAWVARAGVGGRSYWICAFAVNQHKAICESNGKRRDSVTRRFCPPCTCGLPKAFNDTAPLLPDGRSVPCEMNKFDDMMRLLAATNPHFSQVVAIDAKFQTFSRAWCIAEVATANEMGMVQDIKVGSAAQLQEYKEELRALRIQDMEASRLEDKATILEAIGDHEAFNASLQHLIFEDLLPSWESLDAQERMEGAGRIIRWQRTSVWTEEAWATRHWVEV